MHFYQKNIGDFNNATRHLTRVERSLFSDAIELYYDTEKPLTSDINKLNRLLLAHTNEEKEALLVVLNEFFILTDDGYFNKRCNEEIIKYHAYMDSKSKAGKASAEQRAKQKATGVEQVLNTTPTKQNQEPITNNQEPCKNMEVINNNELSNEVGAKKSAPKKNGSALPSDWLLPKAWGNWALSERPELTADCVRKESEKFKDHWLANANQAKSKKSDWLAAWRNWIRNASIHKGAMPAATSREAGRQVAASSIFTPENTQHLQGVQLKTVTEVNYDQTAITA